MKLFWLLLSVLPLYANDTIAAVAAGGIEFKKSSDISMESEILKISLDQIQVTYQFRNHSEKAIEETVAFPLPATPVSSRYDNPFPHWDEYFQAMRFITENPLDRNQPYFWNTPLYRILKGTPFVNFERKTNGAEKGYNYQIIAKDANGQNITALLKKNDIPLSAIYLINPEGPPLSKAHPQLYAKLKRLRLVEGEKPTWKTQTIYFWKESFQPGLTKVEHSYKPAVGQCWMTSPTPELFGPKSQTDYGIDAASWKKLIDSLANHFPHAVKEVQYILTTGANWKESIKKFRLEIKLPTPTTIIFFKKWPGMKETRTKEGYIYESDAFIPPHDLKILFIDLDRKNSLL